MMNKKQVKCSILLISHVLYIKITKSDHLSTWDKMITFYNQASQDLDLFAGTSVTPPLSENSYLRLLHESHIGTIFSPVTSALYTCAPSVAALLHPATEQVLGQVFPELLIQCCFHVPHEQERSAVPDLFFQPTQGNVISFTSNRYSNLISSSALL